MGSCCSTKATADDILDYPFPKRSYPLSHSDFLSIDFKPFPSSQKTVPDSLKPYPDSQMSSPCSQMYEEDHEEKKQHWQLHPVVE
ncbi:hypothetical protein Pcinc_015558 [Petrolisthes cinctipes]|uniref:Uncharacterized protein n=1 Tax=Petrolisthes cinctipes TaxID=88211 RepID=A0AAE1FT39_PETCI|nr:hypothetical protein Pcinc_015558 [Petrolisthes cinctipes]